MQQAQLKLEDGASMASNSSKKVNVAKNKKIMPPMQQAMMERLSKTQTELRQPPLIKSEERRSLKSPRLLSSKNYLEDKEGGLSINEPRSPLREYLEGSPPTEQGTSVKRTPSDNFPMKYLDQNEDDASAKLQQSTAKKEVEEKEQEKATEFVPEQDALLSTQDTSTATKKEEL